MLKTTSPQVRHTPSPAKRPPTAPAPDRSELAQFFDAALAILNRVAQKDKPPA